MERRDFLRASVSGLLVGAFAPTVRGASDPAARDLLVLVELKGGNDGLNTVVPYADPLYAKLRPRLALERDTLAQLTPSVALNPALEKLVALWTAGELAVVQGLGYPDPNLSHFRSIEIWDTASRSDEYLETGWLSRAFTRSPSPPGFAADGVVVGAADMGPLAGAARSIALTDPAQFLRSARLVRAEGESRNAALAHILRVEREILKSAERLTAAHAFRTAFPSGPFGNAIRTAAQLAANPAGIAAIRVTLDGFDTHANQTVRHANLLRSLGEGLAALRSALVEIGRWESTVVATYSEFGRRPAANQSGGTDHGTANAHLVLGGRVKGGLHGEPPRLDRLDGNGNLPFAVDFRSYYATLLERWWQVDSRSVLGGQYPSLGFLGSPS